MEEADALGDDVCILDHGEVQATGTPLELKNAHGTGYQVKLLTWQGRLAELQAFATSALPQAQVMSTTGTSLSVVIPREHFVHLPAFLATLQSIMRRPEAQRVVKDWSIQNASLEQVFLKLTRPVNDDNTVKVGNQSEMLALVDQNTARANLPRLTSRGRLPSQIWAVLAKVPRPVRKSTF